jgi:hypothetical protein
VFETYAKDELGTDKDIQISADDSREVRELKQIVNGSGLLPLRMSDINAQLQSLANFIAKQTEFFGKMLAYLNC